MTEQTISTAPDPAGAADLADFIERLRTLRAYAGSPPFRLLAKRVGPLLKPPQEVTHSTISDVFDPTRRRLNQELVAAIVQALGVPEAQAARWRAACVAAHATRRAVGTAGVFRQLPAELATFTGRREELDELAALVGLAGQAGLTRPAGSAEAPHTVVVSAIEGMAGVGKTQLVIRAAHELVRAGRFADVQLYVNLRGFDADAAPADPADVLDSFLRQLEVPARSIPAGRDERAAMFRDRIAGRDALLVLDNAADEAQVADLIPADPRCLVLITSRRNLAGLDGARLFRLDVFPLRDALELLARILGRARLDAEPEAASEVVRLCGLLPLAVSLAAARLRSRPSWSLERLAAYLRDSGLDAVRAGGRELRPVFDLSYRDLPPATARAFRLLSLHPGRGFTSGAVAALTGTPEGAARGALEALVDENLVEQRTADRYELHDLLHAYALERAEADESAAEREEALARLVSWYLHTAENVSAAVEKRRLLEALPPRPGEPSPPAFDSAPEAMAWYDAERENLSAVLAHAADAGWHELALRLPVTLLGCYQLRTDWPHWRAAYETGLASAREIGDRAAENRLLNGLGLVLYDVHEYTEAIGVYHEALALAEDLDNQPQVASILGNIAGCHSRLGDYTTAEGMHRRGLALFRELGNPQQVASSLTNLGNMLHEARRLEESRTAQTQALAAAREAGNRRYEAIIAFNRAEVCMDLDRPAEAEQDYRLALTAAREAGDRPVEAEALRSLARPLKALARPAEARAALREALAVFESLGSPEAEATRERLAGFEG